MRVQEFMTPAPIAIDLETTIGETMELMHSHAIRHLPVVEGAAVMGLVSDRDLAFLHAMPQLYSTLHESDVEQVLARPVKDIMKLRFIVDQDVVTTTAQSPVEEAIEKLLLHRLSALPVLDSESGALVGILSYVDVLTVYARTT